MQTRRTALAILAALPFASSAMAHGGHAPTVLRSISVGGRRIDYLVRLAGPAPAPMLLCFGGGNANRGIAEYYKAVYTPEAVYRDHHMIIPIGAPDQYFHQYDNAAVREMLSALVAAEPIAGRGLISGVSNGGRAAFRFAAAVPEAFRGILTMPGALIGDPVPAAWKDYAILLTYGAEDPNWKAEAERAYAALKGRAGALERVEFAGQGHVVSPDFDADPVYARLQEMEGRLGR